MYSLSITNHFLPEVPISLTSGEDILSSYNGADVHMNTHLERKKERKKIKVL
jgi:small nuclear ribonucleoprotein (snRNP)-like protein